MLVSRGDNKRFYVTGVSLFGNAKQDGWGAWNLSYYDKDRNHVNAHIPFPTGRCNLHYYPHDYQKNGGDKEVDFDSAAKLLGKLKK